jgi:copper chaperone NosL
MTRLVPLALFASMLVLVGCGSGPLPPATLDARGDACASCRMAVSAAGVVAQLVAPGEEPRFFDDIGCLASFLKDHAEQPTGAIAYVVDHRTRNWVQADAALYRRVPDLETPMGSHLVAHADEQSQKDDEVSARGSATANADVFGARTPPGPEGPSLRAGGRP